MLYLFIPYCVRHILHVKYIEVRIMTAHRHYMSSIRFVYINIQNIYHINIFTAVLDHSNK